MSDGERVRPRLSVVLATDAYDTIRPMIAALARQRCAQAIEPVIVLPTSASDSIRHDELASFAGAQIVTRDTAVPLAPARAAGVRAATAPVVFIGETHAYPQAGWAEAMLARFDDAWTAVVPGIDNANPGGAISRGSYLFDYGPWNSRRPPGEMLDPLIYNTGYRRDALVALGPQLERALDPSEETLWARLGAAGHRAVFAPDARLLHVNVGHLRSLVLEKFCAGAVLGMRRASRWSSARRLFYAAACPLIAVVLVTRSLVASRRAGLASLSISTVASIVVAASAKATGELMGYIGLRMPRFETGLANIELQKVRYAGRRR